MGASISSCMLEINKKVYRYFSKKEPIIPKQKVAWITSLCPVELLEAFDVAYIYPESYAAVVAASGKEQECLTHSLSQGLSLDCCSYSACFQGCLGKGSGPRGLPPKPDILIASNNQCNTLPNWWNLMAEQFNVPLFVIDYPGEYNADVHTREYVDRQHHDLIALLSEITQTSLDIDRLSLLIDTSRKNVDLWKSIVALLPEYDISVGSLFDRISPLILARCLPETTRFFTLLKEECMNETKRDTNLKRIYWLGYPFWYQRERVLPALDAHIVGGNYLSWWNMCYDGEDVWERLYNAYNFTFLNLSAESKSKIILDDIHCVKAEALVINHNKSCKRDFATFRNEYMMFPAAIIESDMIDRNYLNKTIAQERIDILLSTI